MENNLNEDQLNDPKLKAMKDLQVEYEQLRILYYKLLERHAAAQNFIDKVRVHFKSDPNMIPRLDTNYWEDSNLSKILVPSLEKSAEFSSLFALQGVADRFFNTEKPSSTKSTSNEGEIESLNEEISLLEADAFSDSTDTLVESNPSQIESLSEEEQLIVLADALKKARLVAEELQLQSLLLVKKVAKLC